MSRIKEETVYLYEELDDSAKEKAREWYTRGGMDYEWWDGVYDDADQVATLLGIEIDRKKPNQPSIWFRGFYSQGDGSSFDGRYAYAKGSIKAIKAYAPTDTELHRIAKTLQDTQRKNFYGISASISSNRDSSIRVSVDSERPLADQDSDDIEEAIRDFNAWVYDRLEAESDYLMSDEVVAESIIANGYEFDEHGVFA